MARIRTIKPEFFRSRSLAKCDRDARLTFAGLWTEADDHGRGVADPRILKGALWALDDDVTHQHVSAHLDVLVATDHIRLYESGGETYFEIANWTEHQASAYRRGEAKHPEPETYLEGVSRDGVQESAGRTEERAGREGNREGKGRDIAPDKPAREPDEIFDAIIEACRLDLSELTAPARGAVNKAVKNLREVGATPDGIKARADVHRQRWPQAECTPSSLAKNYAQLGVARPVSVGKGSPSEPPPRDADYLEGWTGKVVGQ